MERAVGNDAGSITRIEIKTEARVGLVRAKQRIVREIAIDDVRVSRDIGLRAFGQLHVKPFSRRTLERHALDVEKRRRCLSEANPKGSKGPREAEIFTSRKVREVREVF